MSSPTSDSPSRRRPLLRIVAALVGIGVASWWFAAGAHRGWHQTQVPTKHTDEVTGIDYVTYEKRFVPGIDVLAAGLGFAVLLVAASFFVRKNQP